MRETARKRQENLREALPSLQVMREIPGPNGEGWINYRFARASLPELEVDAIDPTVDAFCLIGAAVCANYTLSGRTTSATGQEWLLRATAEHIHATPKYIFGPGVLSVSQFNDKACTQWPDIVVILNSAERMARKELCMTE